MNLARLPRCLLSPYLGPFFMFVSLFPLSFLCAESLFLSPPLSLCLFSFRTPGFFFFHTRLSCALFSTVSHSQPSLLSSLVLFHTRSPPHKVAFLSLIFLFPRSFLLRLSCAFEIPFSSFALSLTRSLSFFETHTHTHISSFSHSFIIPKLK